MLNNMNADYYMADVLRYYENLMLEGRGRFANAVSGIFNSSKLRQRLFRPGRLIIDAYRLHSLMDTSDEAMAALHASGNFHDIKDRTFTFDTIRLNYCDQFLFRIENVKNQRINRFIICAYTIYRDGVIIYKGAFSPTSSTNSQQATGVLASAACEALPSLPAGVKTANTSDVSADVKLYWAYLDEGADRRVFTLNSDVFIDVDDSKHYKFVESEKNSLHSHVVGGVRGRLVEVGRG